MKYFQYLPRHAKRDEIERLHLDRQRWVSQQKKGFLRYRTPYELLQKYHHGSVDCSRDTVTIGLESEVSGDDQLLIRDQLHAFMPWRKGPYSIFGIDIDAEWRSEKKWHRLKPFLPDLTGKLIADIGCSNGYYMFRMAPHNPKYVLGFEPSVQPYFCFKALNSMAGFNNLEIDLLGVEHISLFPETFDIIFLMGVIYHRPSPVEVLRDVWSSLKPGGTLLLESQIIPGESPLALFPEKSYAKAPGTYFVPTAACLHNWLLRAGFIHCTFCNSCPMSEKEQRRTQWMVFESFSDFLNPADPRLTVEGYPAPWRAIFRAEKKGTQS